MKKDNTLFNLGLLFSSAIIFVLGIFAFYIDTFSNKVITKDTQSFAFFGDFIGGTLNPILAFLAFLALLYTIKIQSDELSATREELAKSAEAQQEQSKSLELQNIATRQQMFDSTFFKLLDLYKSVKKSLYFELIEYKYDEKSICFLETEKIPFKLTTHKRPFENRGYQVFAESALVSYLENIKFIEKYNKKYVVFHKKVEKYVGTYFSTLYQIFNFIENSNINDKKTYSKFLRSQLSQVELEILYYHCISDIGKKRFKPLIEGYSFFEHINLEKNMESRLLEYEIEAFGKNEEIILKYNELKEKSTSAKAEDL